MAAAGCLCTVRAPAAAGSAAAGRWGYTTTCCILAAPAAASSAAPGRSTTWFILVAARDAPLQWELELVRHVGAVPNQVVRHHHVVVDANFLQT